MADKLQKQFTFVDLFAGIGGFRLGLEAIGGECVASSEIDPHANKVYRSNWPHDRAKHNLSDICQIQELPKHDLLVGGVPCQSWSIAGKNRGIEDPRGKLWLEVIRLLKQHRPTAFIFENVKGLADLRHRNALQYLIDSFSELGYQVSYRVLNSFDFNTPQNRDRIFIIGIQQKSIQSEFIWPQPQQNHRQLFEIFDNLEHPNHTKEPIFIQRNLFGERIHVGHNKLTPAGSKNQFFILTDIRNGATSIHSWDIYEDISEWEKTICLTMLRNRRKPKYGSKDGNPISYQDLVELIPDLQEAELQLLIEKKILRQYEETRKYEFFNRKLSGGIDGVYRIYLPTSTFFPTLMVSGTFDFMATVNVQGRTDTEYKENFIRKVLIPKKYRHLKPEESS
ncbi:MAG: DNA cytosine methyltransferase [Limnothrix sp. RL_2_0]|nr:DNA cytosine methyltransferase [Limnothrix sp. RL_2_0]